MTGTATELVVGDAVIASVAAAAAARVPGVARLEPGVLGLVGHLARSGRQLWIGQEPAVSAGVRVRRAGGLLDIQVDLALSGSGAVVEVGRAVQRAVSEAVSESTGAEVDSVRVFVLDIEPGRP
ncbi:Asp23/Gls24 family envelope stress response protein [Nocardia neocaledoniensis]|uniref:Asp23/Gls24 family envelope stress response protein n=1 Tax=Nocardia neocaledoniensis TaxID=236511 RepID=UPI002456BC1F|nr:Asp23/Gls24 family envelope stress response protein [Nocardia neocaledoniensis]